MPKKKSSVHAKPCSPAHPSLISSNRAAARLTAEASPEARSVNDRLQQLRLPKTGGETKSFGPPPTPSIHPSLQAILQIPDAPLLRPRPGLRTFRGRRGPPGPAPPNSWVEKSSARKSESSSTIPNGRTAPALPGYDIPKAGTLLSSALNQLARDWEFHFEYDQYYLATIPVRYKELLLHFIALHNPHAIDRKGLERLFLDETELEGATGAVDLLRLNLSVSIGRSIALKDLKTFFAPRYDSTPTAVAADTNKDPMLRQSSIPESWDSTLVFPQSPLHLSPRLETLTHLSLSCPPPTISWSNFLNHLLPYLPSQSLTHLSLAFWPFPTLTPNALTATSLSPTGPIQAGGSNYYSSYDSDWTEPALILRRIARATLGLQWLDLTGDWPWMQALADEGFDWSGGGLWASLETLVIGQGWLPELFAQSVPHSPGFDVQSDGPYYGTNCSPPHIDENNEDSDNNNIAMIETPTDPWHQRYTSTSIQSSVPGGAMANGIASSPLHDRALVEWVRIEQASLFFERKIKTKLKQAAKFSPSIETNQKEDDDWTVPISSVASASVDLASENTATNGDVSRDDDKVRLVTAQRRRGIQFQREWSEGWVGDAVDEIWKQDVNNESRLRCLRSI